MLAEAVSLDACVGSARQTIAVVAKRQKQADFTCFCIISYSSIHSLSVWLLIDYELLAV
jgi:hypothetical protein